MRAHILAGVVVAGTGCAAAPMREAVSPAPPSAPAVVVAETPAPAIAAPPPPPPERQQLADAPASLGAAAAVVDLHHAEQELAASAGSCRSACRALGAMDDAAGRLCNLASEPSEKNACEESKAKVLGARSRVASSCTSCPGTSVDPRAPVPSGFPSR